MTLYFPGMLIMYFLSDFEIVPVAPIITGITFVFTFHMRCISIVRSLLLLLLLLLLLFEVKYLKNHNNNFFPVQSLSVEKVLK